jgi:hypothetical protein
MKRFATLMAVLVAALFLTAACAKKAEEAPKAEQPKAEEKKAEEAPAAEEPKAEEAPAAEEPKAEEAPAAEAAANDPVDPHGATAENLLVATYAVPGLDDDAVRKLTVALADRDGVVSAKADKAAGLFLVTYSSGCPHSMLAALQTVVAEAQLQGVTARTGDAPPAGGCGGCPNKNTCGGSH